MTAGADRAGPVDLVVRGGTVVTGTGAGAGEADVAVANGVVVAVADRFPTPESAHIIDARGCLVLPGALDLHVHLTAAGSPAGAANGFVDDFDVGTAAAAAGGVTTVGQMSFAEDGWNLPDALRRDLAAARRSARVDYLLHPGLVTPTPDDVDRIDDIAAAGHAALKIVSPTFGGDPDIMEQAVIAAAAQGLLTLIHCEDADIIGDSCRRLIDAGHGGLEHFACSRPVRSEVASVDWAIELCRRTGAPMVLVHLSSATAVRRAARARDEGLPLFVETRPMYLHLTDDVFTREEPGRFTGMPPVRRPADVAALWTALADGRIDTVASDHAPWRRADKVDPSLDVATARMGVADLETLVPMLFSAGVVAGRIDVNRFVAVTSTNAAQLYGLYPRKGCLEVGSDADLMVLDPQASWVVDGTQLRSAAGYSVYDGMPVTGAIRHTVSRGDLVYSEGEVTGPAGRGRPIRRRYPASDASTVGRVGLEPTT